MWKEKLSLQFLLLQNHDCNNIAWPQNTEDLHPMELWTANNDGNKPKQFEVNGIERPINLRRKTILDRYFILGSLIICNRTLNQEPITGRHSLQNTCCYWRLQNKKDQHFKNSETWTYSRGGSRIFLGGGALISCSTSTPINHIVFFGRIPVVLENRRSIFWA